MCCDGIDCGRYECGGCDPAVDDIVLAVAGAGGFGGAGPTDAAGGAVISI